MINSFGILKCSMHLCNFVIISALFRFRIIVKLGFYVSMLALTFKDLPKYESVFFSPVDTGPCIALFCHGHGSV